MSYNSPYNNTNFSTTGAFQPAGGRVKPWNKPDGSLNQQLKNKSSALWGIVTSPLLHGSFSHLIGNTVPGFIFSFLIGMSGKRVFWEVTIIAGLIGGIGTWIFGGIGTNHIGASGLIYGWLGYLIVRGIFNKDIKQFLLGVVLAFIYSGLFWGLLPTQIGVSWQGHLFGALGGIGAGAFITSDDPAALKAKKQQKKLEKQQRQRGL